MYPYDYLQGSSERRQSKCDGRRWHTQSVQGTRGVVTAPRFYNNYRYLLTSYQNNLDFEDVQHDVSCNRKKKNKKNSISIIGKHLYSCAVTRHYNMEISFWHYYVTLRRLIADKSRENQNRFKRKEPRTASFGYKIYLIEIEVHIITGTHLVLSCCYGLD